MGEDSDVGNDVGPVGEEDVLGIVEVIRMDRKEQAAGGLGIGEKDLKLLGNVLGEGRENLGEFEVLAGAAGNAALLDEPENVVIDRGDGVGVDAGGDSGLTAHVAEVSEETKAGNVGSGAGESDGSEGRSGGVEGGHFPGGLGGEGGGGEAFLDRSGDDAGAERFCEEEVVARLGAGIGNDTVWIDESGHGESVEGLGVLHGVSTGESTAGFRDLVGSASQNLIDGVEREKIGRHRDDIHRGDGPSTHGVDVGERVGSRDLPEEIGIIDDGGEEIEGLDQGQIRSNPVNGGIVGTGGSDEEIGVLNIGEATQDLREFGLAELGGSPSAGRHFGQAFDIFATHRTGR